MHMIPAIPDVGVRTRRRIAWRLLPFVFLLYVVAYLDRANVSFAALRMNLDLGFTDRVYGLGVALFYLGYVLFEIPGAIIVERWSARKWTARIMISWGIATIFSGFVYTAAQFYAARFFLGLAEASFFPGMIVYLTDYPSQARWLSLAEREWISTELQSEKQAKKETQAFTIWQAFRDRRTLLLLLPYFLANTSNTSVVFWLPTFIKRLSGLPSAKVALLVLLPSLAGLLGLLINGWHSDKTGERRWHTAVPLTCLGMAYLLLISVNANFPLAMALFTLAGG